MSSMAAAERGRKMGCWSQDRPPRALKITLKSLSLSKAVPVWVEEGCDMIRIAFPSASREAS